MIRAPWIFCEKRELFGFSACCSKNLGTTAIGSDEFVDLMIEKGCLFGWYFTYIFLSRGRSDRFDCICRAACLYVSEGSVNKWRSSKPHRFLLDFCARLYAPPQRARARGGGGGGGGGGGARARARRARFFFFLE